MFASAQDFRTPRICVVPAGTHDNYNLSSNFTLTTDEINFEVDVVFYLNSSTFRGSTTANYGLTMGAWPVGNHYRLHMQATNVYGNGGAVNATGGPALNMDATLTADHQVIEMRSSSRIYSGGGGGGPGGQGARLEDNDKNPADCTFYPGGSGGLGQGHEQSQTGGSSGAAPYGGPGGPGGTYGNAGTSGSGGSGSPTGPGCTNSGGTGGKAAGTAINQVSNCSFVTYSGTILGPQIN